MNKKLNFIFNKKKINKKILYSVLFIAIIFFVYFLIPKFLDYPHKIIKESLKKNSNLNIKNIEQVNYKLFPSPRLRLSGSSLVIENNILTAEDADIDIVLNPLTIINRKVINYNKILISGGLINVQIDRVNQLLEYIEKNKNKINFKKSNIYLFKEKKKLLEIKNSKIKIHSNKSQSISIRGFFLNHKIIFSLKKKSETKNDITLKIPELDISSNISFMNKSGLNRFNGIVNFQVLDNFFQFNLVKKENITINKGFVRNNLINAAIEGKISFKPHFFFNLNITPSKLNLEELIIIIKNKYYSENFSGIEIIKKINGFLNIKSMFKGNIIFENGEILFKNFKANKNSSISFNAKISEFGNLGKINFDLIKEYRNKENSISELKISGLILPASSRVIFKNILSDKKDFKVEEIKNYEKQFNSEVVHSSLINIFSKSKINKFFEEFTN